MLWPASDREKLSRRKDQSSSPSESLLEFELLLELEFELEFELLFELELELLFEFEFEFELELELEFDLLSEFELELLDDSVWLPFSSFFQNPPSSSSASTGAAKEVATKATVANLVMVFIGGVLLCKKQPSVTAPR
jgi:hypothetical protein